MIKVIAHATQWEWTCPVCQEINTDEEITPIGIYCECQHCPNERIQRYLIVS